MELRNQVVPGQISTVWTGRGSSDFNHAAPAALSNLTWNPVQGNPQYSRQCQIELPPATGGAELKVTATGTTAARASVITT